MRTSTASTRRRHRCPIRRAVSPVIHRDWPAVVAILPSRLCPTFAITHGNFDTIAFSNGAFSRLASSAITPLVTRIHERRSFASPRPFVVGFGSRAPITTRATPARTIASEHGGVRPWWLQGSGGTYRAAPRARRGPGGGAPAEAPAS